MKGVFELTWKIALILIAGLMAFAIIFLLTTQYADEVGEFFKDFSIEKLIEIWNNMTGRQ